MLIKIGNKIKSLRQKNSVTQDRLAEYLGVTAQAISRWESEVCYPDIEILPAISDFFNVSADELMGIDVTKRNERINDYIKQARDCQSQGRWEEAVRVYQNALKEYPSSYQLHLELACAIGCIDNGEKISAELADEAETLCIRVLDNCVDDKLRSRTLAILCWIYHHHMNDDEKAYAVADRLPGIGSSREFVLAETYKKGLPDEKRNKFLNDYIGQMLILFNNRIAYSDDKNEKIDTLINELQKIKLCYISVDG